MRAFVSILLSAAIFTVGVVANDTSPTPKVPVKIGILGDQTGSAVQNSSPVITPDTLEPLITCAIEHGGEIAVTVVRDRAEGGLVRLSVDAPLPEPKPPTLRGVPLNRQVVALKTFRRMHQQWETDDAQRAHESATKAGSFRQQLHVLLDGVRRDSRSDVASALRRLDRFLQEATDGTVQLGLLIASDVQDTTGGRYVMTSPATTAWVYRSDRAPKSIVLPASLSVFEGLDVAVRHLHRQLCTSGKGSDHD